MCVLHCSDSEPKQRVSVGKRLSYFRWKDYKPDPAFWSPQTAKKNRNLATSSLRHSKISKLCFSDEAATATDDTSSTSLASSSFLKPTTSSSVLSASARVTGSVSSSQNSLSMKRKLAQTETSGIPQLQASKRPRLGQQLSASARMPSSTSASTKSESKELLQLINNLSDRVDKLSQELKKEREARAALEKRVTEMRTKLTVAHII